MRGQSDPAVVKSAVTSTWMEEAGSNPAPGFGR